MQALIRTESLTHRFGGLTAVEDVNWELREGQLASIIGPNGAGKSTLFKLITGMYTPTNGRIYFDGTDITHTPAYGRVDKGLLMSSQICSIFPRMTVLENLVVASQRYNIHGMRAFFLSSWKNKEILKKVEEILSTVDLLHYKDSLAEGIPQGCKKRLEMGMTLAMKPRVVLLDEPTAGATDKEVHQIMDLIRELNKKLTIVVVEHKMEVVMGLSERITVMHKGRIVAEGSPEEIRSNDLVHQIYLGGIHAHR